MSAVTASSTRASVHVDLSLATIAGMLGTNQGETNHCDLASVGFTHLHRNLRLLSVALADYRRLLKAGAAFEAEGRLALIVDALESSDLTAQHLSEVFELESEKVFAVVTAGGLEAAE